MDLMKSMEGQQFYSYYWQNWWNQCNGIAGTDENDGGNVIDGTIKEKNLMETIDGLNPTNGSEEIDGTDGIGGINVTN